MKVGDKFGRLTIIGKGYNEHGQAFECRCDCGRVKVIRASNLRSGNTESCGCLKRDTNHAKLASVTRSVLEFSGIEAAKDKQARRASFWKSFKAKHGKAAP